MHAWGMGWNVITLLEESHMSKTKRRDTLDNLAVVHPNAAGLDIGARELEAIDLAQWILDHCYTILLFPGHIKPVNVFLVSLVHDAIRIPSRAYPAIFHACVLE